MQGEHFVVGFPGNKIGYRMSQHYHPIHRRPGRLPPDEKETRFTMLWQTITFVIELKAEITKQPLRLFNPEGGLPGWKSGGESQGHRQEGHG